MFWTHFFDLVGKILSILVMVGMALLMRGFGWRGQLAPFVVVGLGSGFLAWILLFRPASSMVYARIRLRTHLSWTESQQASFLFSPVLRVWRWYPTLQVRDLPEADRSDAVMSYLKAIKAQEAKEWLQWKASGWTKKVHTALEILSVIVCGILTFTHMPPASWVSELQSRLSDDGTYSPMVTLVLCAVPVSLLFRIFDPGTNDRVTRIGVTENQIVEQSGVASVIPATALIHQIDNRSDDEKYGPAGQS
ncbi:MAG: hypothetical protein NTV80_06095 [Verrucomicrobia bacterium]|nr:hypothetical protein [Verrucomicrobiota bacterium]